LGTELAQEMVRTMVPSHPENGAHIGAVRLASETYQSASLCTEAGDERNKNGDPKIAATLDNVERCCPERACPTALTIDREVDPLKVSPTGFEPVTFGFGGRERSSNVTVGIVELNLFQFHLLQHPGTPLRHSHILQSFASNSTGSVPASVPASVPRRDHATPSTGRGFPVLKPL